ncbi:MAG: DsbA family oxidoreductase [Oscillospiraceae bacterium]|nr:DsbA family oxidoreductase [Oscillospiraceae bacterium]
MNIIFWSDYACPYCYIGETNLKKAIRELKSEYSFEVQMKAFELDDRASREYTGTTVDRFAEKHNLSPEEAREQVDSISALGREAGLDFNYADTRYTNTFDALRLTKFAQKKSAELADRLSERFFHAYFCECLELADHDVLLRIAVEEGLPEDEVKQVLATDACGPEVRWDETMAQRNGINTVPFYILDRKYAIPGALSVENFKQILLGALNPEEDPEDAGE